MRKIPTLFRRDPDDRKHVLPQVDHAEWVLYGEGIATRTYDGTRVQDGRRAVVGAAGGQGRKAATPGN